MNKKIIKTFSVTNTDFGNFRLEDPNKYISIPGDGQIVEYKLISRTKLL